MSQQPSYRVTRHISFEGSNDGSKPPIMRSQSMHVSNPLLSQDLQPATSYPRQENYSVHSVDQIPKKQPEEYFRHASHLRPIPGGENLLIPILPEVTIVKEQIPEAEATISRVQKKEEPTQEILYQSRKSSSSSAREHKERMREAIENDKVAETRIVVDPSARKRIQDRTPATQDKFWRDTLKESRMEVHYDRTDLPQQIPQVFRYCFVCQNSILQYNIGHHEKVCSGFNQLIDKSVEQITRILQYKIDRLMKQLKQRSPNPQYSIAPCISQFLVECDKVKQRGNHMLHWQFESKFMKVEACWTDVKMLELAHRLRWFMRIREQITNRYQI